MSKTDITVSSLRNLGTWHAISSVLRAAIKIYLQSSERRVSRYLPIQSLNLITALCLFGLQFLSQLGSPPVFSLSGFKRSGIM